MGTRNAGKDANDRNDQCRDGRQNAVTDDRVEHAYRSPSTIDTVLAFLKRLIAADDDDIACGQAARDLDHAVELNPRFARPFRVRRADRHPSSQPRR